MRSSGDPEIFFQKMKKKPALQQILDNLDDYTVEELDTIQGQPKWIRKQLCKLKNGESILTQEADTFMAHAEKILKQEKFLEKIRKEAATNKYEVRRWVGFDTWNIPGNTFMFQVKEGDLFFIESEVKHQIRLSSFSTNLNEQNWQYFYNQTIKIDDMTKTEYNLFVSNELVGKHGQSVVDINLNPNVKLQKIPNIDEETD